MESLAIFISVVIAINALLCVVVTCVAYTRDESLYTAYTTHTNNVTDGKGAYTLLKNESVVCIDDETL